MRLAARRLRGGAPSRGDERTKLQRIAVATTVLVFSLVLPTVDIQWQLQAPEAVSVAVDSGPNWGQTTWSRTTWSQTTWSHGRGPDASAAHAPRQRDLIQRDLILGSDARAAMSRMTAGY